MVGCLRFHKMSPARGRSVRDHSPQGPAGHTPAQDELHEGQEIHNNHLTFIINKSHGPASSHAHHLLLYPQDNLFHHFILLHCVVKGEAQGEVLHYGVVVWK